MKKEGIGKIHKVIAVALIVIVSVLLVGIVANGTKAEPDGDNSSENGNLTDKTDNPNGDTDDKGTADNNTQNQAPDEPALKPPPEFTSYLTGLEIGADQMNKLPFVFVCDPDAPLYGISGSEMVIEVPVEDGDTRYLVYRSDISTLGKIGASVPTRKYISQLVDFFGGILVAYGEDDLVLYDHIPNDIDIDLSLYPENIYRENGKNVYTDNQYLDSILKTEGIDPESYKLQPLPFAFCDCYETVLGNTSANTIQLSYSDKKNTSVTYDSENGVYLLSKDGRGRVDMLTGNAASFTNVFVLFADIVTYERSSGTQTVVETASRGSGYYISRGTLCEIRWYVDQNNELIFTDLNGETLVINRGNSYIGYFKASERNNVTFE